MKQSKINIYDVARYSKKLTTSYISELYDCHFRNTNNTHIEIILSYFCVISATREEMVEIIYCRKCGEKVEII